MKGWLNNNRNGCRSMIVDSMMIGSG